MKKSLSVRELEVFKLVVEGRGSRDIASQLCVSIRTIDHHRENIKKKLGTGSPYEQTLIAVHMGVLPCPCERHLSLEAADKIARIIETTDRGCGYCVQDLADKLNKTFPAFRWVQDESRDAVDIFPMKALRAIEDGTEEE